MLKRGGYVLLMATTVLLVGETSRSATAEWGSVKGRIVVENEPPKPEPLFVAKDPFCIEKNPPNESLILGKNKELVNAVVYLRVAKGAANIAVHPEYAENSQAREVITIKDCRFQPHVVLMRVGQELVIKNDDPVGHNANVPFQSFGRPIPSGPEQTFKIKQAVTQPMPVVCNIHPWMKAYLLSLDHPYAAVTGQDGRFEIKDIPAGEHEFQFWHDTGYLKGGRMKTGATDQRGRIKLNIPTGQTLGLGDVKVRL